MVVLTSDPVKYPRARSFVAHSGRHQWRLVGTNPAQWQLIMVNDMPLFDPVAMTATASMTHQQQQSGVGSGQSTTAAAAAAFTGSERKKNNINNFMDKSREQQQEDSAMTAADNSTDKRVYLGGSNGVGTTATAGAGKLLKAPPAAPPGNQAFDDFLRDKWREYQQPRAQGEGMHILEFIRHKIVRSTAFAAKKFELFLYSPSQNIFQPYNPNTTGSTNKNNEEEEERLIDFIYQRMQAVKATHKTINDNESSDSDDDDFFNNHLHHGAVGDNNNNNNPWNANAPSSTATAGAATTTPWQNSSTMLLRLLPVPHPPTPPPLIKNRLLAQPTTTAGGDTTGAAQGHDDNKNNSDHPDFSNPTHVCMEMATSTDTSTQWETTPGGIAFQEYLMTLEYWSEYESMSARMKRDLVRKQVIARAPFSFFLLQQRQEKQQWSRQNKNNASDKLVVLVQERIDECLRRLRQQGGAAKTKVTTGKEHSKEEHDDDSEYEALTSTTTTSSTKKKDPRGVYIGARGRYPGNTAFWKYLSKQKAWLKEYEHEAETTALQDQFIRSVVVPKSPFSFYVYNRFEGKFQPDDKQWCSAMVVKKIQEKIQLFLEEGNDDENDNDEHEDTDDEQDDEPMRALQKQQKQQQQKAASSKKNDSSSHNNQEQQWHWQRQLPQWRSMTLLPSVPALPEIPTPAPYTTATTVRSKRQRRDSSKPKKSSKSSPEEPDPAVTAKDKPDFENHDDWVCLGMRSDPDSCWTTYPGNQAFVKYIVDRNFVPDYIQASCPMDRKEIVRAVIESSPFEYYRFDYDETLSWKREIKTECTDVCIDEIQRQVDIIAFPPQEQTTTASKTKRNKTDAVEEEIDAPNETVINVDDNEEEGEENHPDAESGGINQEDDKVGNEDPDQNNTSPEVANESLDQNNALPEVASEDPDQNNTLPEVENEDPGQNITLPEVKNEDPGQNNTLPEDETPTDATRKRTLDDGTKLPHNEHDGMEQAAETETKESSLLEPPNKKPKTMEEPESMTTESVAEPETPVVVMEQKDEPATTTVSGEEPSSPQDEEPNDSSSSSLVTKTAAADEPAVTGNDRKEEEAAADEPAVTGNDRKKEEATALQPPNQDEMLPVDDVEMNI